MTKARWISASATGTVLTSAHVRWLSSSATGTAAVVVNPLPDLGNVEPESTVSVTASLVGGGAADSWAWRRVSGPTIGIITAGASASFTAPSVLAGTSVVVGVTATVGATTSPEDTFTVTVLPQTEWWWTGTGWIPQVETWAA